MRKSGILWGAAVLMALLGHARGEDKDKESINKSTPDFKEVYDLIREHAGGIGQDELDRAAVKGLVWALAPRVVLITNDSQNAGSSVSAVMRSNLFEGGIAYVRVGQVASGLPQAVRGAAEEVKGTNRLKGLVLDLRYAGGDDYASAAGVVDLFLKKEEPLLNWGNGVVRSKEKKDAISV